MTEEKKQPSPMEQNMKEARGKTQVLPAPSKSDSEVVLDMMNKILSREDIEQKSRQIFENIKGICQIEVMTNALINGAVFNELDPVDGFKFIDPMKLHELDDFKDLPEFKDREKRFMILSSIRLMCEQITTRLVSLDGLGRSEMIELAKAFSFQIQQHQHEDSMMNKVLQPGGMAGRR